MCEYTNDLPCGFGSARFESTKSREIEPTCPSVLIYLPRLDEPGFDAAAGIPFGEGEGSELRAVVQSQRSGFGVRLSLPGGR